MGYSPHVTITVTHPLNGHPTERGVLGTLGNSAAEIQLTTILNYSGVGKRGSEGYIRGLI